MATPRKKPEEKLRVGKKPWVPTPADLEKISDVANIGATDTQIQVLLGISHETFYKYRKIYPEFDEAIKKAKKKSNSLVESSLFKSAMKGNPASIIYWLKNRSQKRWSDRNTVRHENADGKNIESVTKPQFVVQVPAQAGSADEWVKSNSDMEAKPRATDETTDVSNQ